MSQQGRNGGGNSKPAQPREISSDPTARLTLRVEKLEQRQQQQNTTRTDELLQKWVGKRIRTRYAHQADLEGVLLWSDKYNICLATSAVNPYSKEKADTPVLVQKGTVTAMWEVTD